MVNFRGKEIEPKQLSYMSAIDINDKPKQERIKILFSECLGLTDEEIQSLTLEEGVILQEAANDVNDAGKFLSQPKKE